MAFTEFPRQLNVEFIFWTTVSRSTSYQVSRVTCCDPRRRRSPGPRPQRVAGAQPASPGGIGPAARTNASSAPKERDVAADASGDGGGRRRQRCCGGGHEHQSRGPKLSLGSTSLHLRLGHQVVEAIGSLPHVLRQLNLGHLRRVSPWRDFSQLREDWFSEHPLRWPALQRVVRRSYGLASFRVRRHETRRHVAGHAVYGASDTPRGGLKQRVGSAEVDGGLGYAGYRDQLLPKERIAEAMDRLFREVDDDAHGDRLWLRVFRAERRRALTRQRQRRVGCLRAR
jgi:hypothetical protein